MLIAHAFGARYDLPLPLWLFVVGAGAVVALSFLVAGRREAVPVLPVEGNGSSDRPVLGLIGVATAALAAACGVYGTQAVAENLLPTAFWLLAWIAVPLSCAVIGDWTRALNPFAFLARSADRARLRSMLLGSEGTVCWPSVLGWWPATALFAVVAGGELVYNGTATMPVVTGIAIVVYGLICAACGLLFGADAWLSRGELFSILFATWGRLGWWRFGCPGRSGFLGGIDQPFEATASRVTFVLLMLMSVTFDGLLSTPQWRDFIRLLPAAARPGSAGYVFVGVGSMLALVGLAWIVFGGCSLAVGRLAGSSGGATQNIAALLPSLLPIAFGYLFAHNFDYLAINGQLLVPLAGNPTGHHQWLPAPFNDSYEVDRNIVPSALVWYLEVAVIITVHVAAVFVAHRHTVARSRPRSAARRGEVLWLGVMVLYTMTSLWLLAQPIVEEHPPRHQTTSALSPAPGTHQTEHSGQYQ